MLQCVWFCDQYNLLFYGFSIYQSKIITYLSSTILLRFFLCSSVCSLSQMAGTWTLRKYEVTLVYPFTSSSCNIKLYFSALMTVLRTGRLLPLSNVSNVKPPRCTSDSHGSHCIFYLLFASSSVNLRVSWFLLDAKLSSSTFYKNTATASSTWSPCRYNASYFCSSEIRVLKHGNIHFLFLKCYFGNMKQSTQLHIESLREKLGTMMVNCTLACCWRTLRFGHASKSFLNL